MTSRDADYFDQWYDDMTRSEVRDGLFESVLGLPPHLLSTSLLTSSGIDSVVAALAVSGGDVLLDLACGRGGYGLEIASRTGARLLGVDFSAVALEQARRRAGELGLDATFQVGELVRTGLADDSVDAVMCVDAVQFASPPVAGLRECRRVLVPDGRLVMTCWEPAEPGDDQLLPQRLRGLDLDRDLRAAGFTDVRVTERPDWREVERTLWEESLKVDAGDDRAMHSMQDEARRSLDTFDQLRRVFATATAP